MDSASWTIIVALGGAVLALAKVVHGAYVKKGEELAALAAVKDQQIAELAAAKDVIIAEKDSLIVKLNRQIYQIQQDQIAFVRKLLSHVSAAEEATREGDGDGDERQA